MKYVGTNALAKAMQLVKAALDTKATVAATTATLAAGSWAGTDAPFMQTVLVTGVTASNSVVVSPDPDDQAAYAAAGCYCSAQGPGTLTFTASTKPEAALSVNVLKLN